MRALLIFSSLFVVFHLAFWQQGMGINLPVFTALICLLIYIKHKPRLTLTHLFLFCCTALSTFGLLIYHTDLSLAVFLLSAFSLTGSLHQNAASVVEGFVNSLLNAFNRKEGLIPGAEATPRLKKQKGYLYLRVAILPLLITLLYVALFSGGNAIFNGFTASFFKKIQHYFENWSAPYVFFILFGLFIVRWATRNQWKNFVQLNPSGHLTRMKKRSHRVSLSLGLRMEYYRALILFISLNLLFLIINFIDIKWVWFGFSLESGFDLKAFVHEGTAYLLVSLLLSIGLVLYFFRGNLNFYPKATWLKRLAYFWVAQNAILAISVVIRTTHYINFHGLASKRIGLLLFVAMVLFGLLTLVLKIVQQRNFAYLLRLNSAFIIGTLAVNACLPWNTIIAKHNLAHGNAHEIDVDNYLSLDPSTFPLLYANLDVIEHQIQAHQNNKVRWIFYENIDQFKTRLDWKAQIYLESESKEGLWSWNRADARSREKLQRLPAS